MIEIKSSMSADKIKGPIVIFTKAKKNSHAPQGLELLDLSWELPKGFSPNVDCHQCELCSNQPEEHRPKKEGDM